MNGQWEPQLRAKSLEILKSVGIKNPKEGITYGSLNDNSIRKVDFIKNADHVGILFSNRTQEEIGRWLKGAFKLDKNFKTNEMGIWIATLLLCIFLFIFFIH